MSSENALTSLWNSHKKNPKDESVFADDAILLYVPTAAGGRGRANIKAFLALANADGESHSEEKVVLTTVGKTSIVEESILNLTVSRNTALWICPGAQLRNVLGKHVKIPLVTSVSFDNGKIASKRVYWDQASALSQIGLLSPSVIKNDELPVLAGGEEAENVHNPKGAILNSLSKLELDDEESKSTEAHSEGSILNQGAAPIQYRLSSRVNQPGGTGGKSSIFSDEPEERKAIPADPRRNRSNISFGGEPEQTHERPVTSTTTTALHNQETHFSIGHGDAPTDSFTAGKKLWPEISNVSQINIGADANAGSTDHDTSITGTPKRPGSASQNNTYVDMGIAASNQPNQVRPSSRVLRPPGGGSSITFG